MKYEFLNIKGNNTADIHLYQAITGATAGAKSISQQVADLVGTVKKLRLFINSPGGSVPEGIALFNILQRFDSLEIYVDGIAASMAAILTQIPNAKVYMSKYAKLMIHRISGNAMGKPEDFVTIAGMMTDFESNLVNIIAEKTGNSPESVKLTYFDNTDHWLNAEQALAAKLITGIVDGKLKVQPPQQDDLGALYAFYKAEILNYSPNNNQMFDKLISLLGFSQEATEQQVEEHITKVLNINRELTTDIIAKEAKIVELQASIDAYQSAKIDELIATATQAGKITAEMKPTYVKLAKQDFDACKTILDSIPAYQPISGQLKPGDTGIPEARKDWTFQDWQKNDGKGLEKMRTEQPDLFNELRNQLGK